jgi:hypothetical protein
MALARSKKDILKRPKRNSNTSIHSAPALSTPPAFYEHRISFKDHHWDLCQSPAAM